MATITVTAGQSFSSGDTVTDTKLNNLGVPTVTISNIGTSDIQNGAITSSKIDTSVLDDAFDAIYPTGSIYIGTGSTPPTRGTWVAFGAGKMLVGLQTGDTDFGTVEQTGGNKTITVDPHTHDVSSTVVQGSQIFEDTSPSDDVYVQPGGGFENKSVLNPYIVVRMWKRTDTV